MGEKDDANIAQGMAQPTFQPDFLGGGGEVSPQGLEAYFLLARLERGARRKGRDFRIKLKKLAPMMTGPKGRKGVDVKTAYNRICELVRAGWLVKRRTNRAMRYIFPDNAPPRFRSAKNCRSGSAKNCGSGSAKNCRSAGDAPLDDLKTQPNSSAAVDLYLPLQIQEAAQALKSLAVPGLTDNLADAYAKKDAALVLVAMPFLRWKLGVKGKEAAKHPVKVVRSVLDSPGKWGFEQVESGWLPPKFDERAPSLREWRKRFDQHSREENINLWRKVRPEWNRDEYPVTNEDIKLCEKAWTELEQS